MKIQSLRVFLLLAASVLGASLSQGAQAATWNGSWSYSNCSAPSVSYGNTYTCTDGTAPADAKMAMTGWSSDLTPSANFVAAAVAPWGSSNGFGIVNTEECAGQSNASGWSICDPGGGPHAADNVGQLEGFLLNFYNPGEKVTVALNNIQIGWNGTDNTSGSYADSDLSVYYWTGASAPTMTSISSAGLPTTEGSALGSWTLLKHLSNVGASNGTTAGGSASFNNSGTTVSSSWWFVSASTSGLGTSGNDAFKLLSVAGVGTSNKTPEPGTLALAGLALFGITRMRRRAAQ